MKKQAQNPESTRKGLIRSAGLIIFMGVAVFLVAACGGTLTEEPTPQSIQEAQTEGPPMAVTETPEAEGGEEEETMTQNQSFAGTQPAPDFPTGLEWLNTERPLSLDQLKGKVVLLDFWTYGCINCMHIIPDLSQLEEEYPDELVVIGVHSAKFENEGDTDNIRQIILRYGLEHPVVNDSDFIVWRTWGARAWPTLVLIDPAGNIVGGHSGENIYPIFQPIIDSLVREFDANGILDRTPLDLKLEKEGLPETVLSFPGKVLADEQGGRLFIADTNHHRIVVVDIESGEVLNVIGNGDAGLTDGDFRDASFTHPQGMALSPDGKILYLADTENHSIRLIDLDEEAVSTLLGTGEQGRVYPPLGGIGPKVALRSPWDLELHEGALYIAMAGSHQIWSYDLVSRVAEPLIGNAFEGTKDGTFREAELAQPSGLALDGTGRLYFSDSEASSIRWGDIQGEEVFTLVGSGESLFEFGDVDGVGRDARLQHPLGVVVLGDTIFITDTYNHKIKNIDPDTSEITTFLGDEAGWRDGDQPLFYEPGGLDVAGDKLYIADTNNHAIRVVDLASLEVSTLVLKGIDRYMTSTDEAYSGDLVRFDPVIVQAGEGRVLLQVDLPEGYKVNDEAPSSIDWNVEGDVVELPIDANITQAGILFPVELEVSFQEGQGMLISDLSIIYCESEKESLCLIEQVRLEVPISASPSGENFIELLYEIPAPKLNSRQ